MTFSRRRGYYGPKLRLTALLHPFMLRRIVAIPACLQCLARRRPRRRSARGSAQTAVCDHRRRPDRRGSKTGHRYAAQALDNFRNQLAIFSELRRDIFRLRGVPSEFFRGFSIGCEAGKAADGTHFPITSPRRPGGASSASSGAAGTFEGEGLACRSPLPPF